MLLISGRNAVLEAVHSGKARKIIVRHGASIHFDDIKVPFEVLGRRDFEYEYGLETQGVVAEIDDFSYSDFRTYFHDNKEKGNVAILDKIQDPHNFGAIIRATHCFGIRDILVPRHDQAGVTPAVYKSSAGALFYSRVFEIVNLGNAVDDLKKLGFVIIAADISEDAVPLKSFEIDDKRKKAIIIGSEGKGIRQSILERADFRVNINMNSKIDSLNASMSSAILCYHLFSK